MDLIYLDNNASTRPAPEVVQAMQQVYEQLWANPSSVHRFGQTVRHRVELARVQIAQLINSRDRELIFTSSLIGLPILRRSTRFTDPVA